MGFSTDTAFSALPQHLQWRIDRAFDLTADPIARRKVSSARLDGEASSGGGFIRGDAQAPGSELVVGGGFILGDSEPYAEGGGFIIEDAGATNVALPSPSEIPFSSVPSALGRLHLPPDDEQVLSVFRNAASGWSSSSLDISEGGDSGGMISRDDWRSVCAVLLEHDAEEYEESDAGMNADDDDALSGANDSQDEESDGYQEEFLPLGAESSDDEYVEGPSAVIVRHRTTNRRGKSLVSSPLSPPGPIKITTRQKRTCLEAFALFFPSVAGTELPNQKIMIKDIQRVAKVLGEKIKAEEMIEMLEMFSTSADKSMGLADFEHMMIAAKLA